MDGMLSQEEINALLGDLNADSSDSSSGGSGGGGELSLEERDAIGEISNICMGTAATTLYSLVNQKVLITTPIVEITTWDDMLSNYAKPSVFINIHYKEGIDGNNVLILREEDVKVITDLMMGGDGLNPSPELTDLHMSAICEAMNQMMGSSATSLSSMLDCKVDISPPEAELIDMTGDVDPSKIPAFLKGEFAIVTFQMTIGELVDSTMMQLYPIDLAKELYKRFTSSSEEKAAPQPAPSVPEPAPAPAPTPQPVPQPDPSYNMANQPMMGQPMMGQPMMGQPMMAQPMMGQDVNVQNVQFKAFNPMPNPALQQENIDLIMDVPLDVSVVLGRTKKSIKEILEFAPGTIVELDKLAGEPIDVMVNQKLVARGEVVVIEESFGIRITDIIKEKM
ncbi:MAG: flagellar motor switch phosphatase FliY [Lachnospiraceae bacterium]|nr:flagellar motor switch phosphatase FliY [Lachnospiraceae bacterium]